LDIRSDIFFKFLHLEEVTELNDNRVGKRQKNSRLWAVAYGLLVLLALSACALAEEKTAEDWYKSGQELEKMGSWKEAVDAYDQAIKLNPDYKEAWCAKCKALSNANLELSGQGQNITFADAVQACDRALEIDPDNSRSWAGKGFVLYNEAIFTANPGKFNESLLAYEKAIEIAGSDTSALSEAWRGKGTVLSQMGRSYEALAAQEKAIELNESDVAAWMGKAISLSKLGRDDEAIQAYDRIFELYPSEEQRIFDYPYIWYSKGRVLEKLGREEEAAQAFNRSVEDVDTIIGWVASGREFYMNLSEAWQYKGQLLEEQGRYEEAVEALDNATNVEPNSIRDWNLKGFLLASELGRYDEAIHAYDRALEIDPEDAEALVGKGNVLRSLARYQEAGELYDRALGITPQLPQNSYQLAKAWYGKGEVLRNQGRNEDALQAYEKVIELDPRYPQDARIGIAMVLDHLDRHEEALVAYNQSLVDYERITKDNPRRSYVWYGLGNALAGLGRYDEAVAAHEKAIELNPRYIDAWLNKGIALSNLAIMGYGLKDPENFTRIVEDSISTHDRAIEIDPENSVAWSEKGFSLGLMGPLNHTKYNESISAYDRAIELMPANDTIMLSFAWMEKGAVLSRQASSTHDTSLYEDAIKAFDKAIELNPQQTGTLVVKANALLNLGRYNESLKTLDEAIETASQDSEKAQIWFEKAHLFAEQGNYNETAKALAKATDLAPEDKNLWINGGVLLSSVLSRYDEAIGYYERALEIDPADGYAWYAKGEAQKALGRQAEADEAYARAKELGYIGLGTSEEMNGEPFGTAEPSVEELATRLLQATYPGSTELNEVQLLAGKLPEDMPVDLPIPDGARIIGSEIQEGQGTYIVLDVPLMPDQVLDFYRKALPFQNWTETDIPGMDRGFVRGDPSITFCQGWKNPSMTVTAHPMDNGTDLHISISSDPDYSPCSQASFDDWLRPIPKLAAPDGSRQFNEMMTGGGNRAAVSATLETEMNSSILEDHYADQLNAANWTRKGEGKSGPSSWSAWSTEDENGLVWNGFLIALDLPGSENQRFVLVQANLVDN